MASDSQSEPAWLEELMAWSALLGFVVFTLVWPVIYAFSGGWGGTLTFSGPLAIAVVGGYGLYCAVLLGSYCLFGQVRVLPWLRKPVFIRDALILFSIAIVAVGYYLLFFIRG